MVEKRSQVGEPDENLQLNELKKCLSFMKNKDFREGVRQSTAYLLEYYDADCVMLLYEKDGEFCYIEKAYREGSEPLVKEMIKAAEQGKVCEAIKTKKPELSEELWDENGKAGYLLVFHPCKHANGKQFLYLIGEYMTARIVHQNILELLEYETTHNNLMGLWNRNSFILWMQDLEEKNLSSLGLITTDIVHLSEINRQLGYFYGNKRMIEVSELLKSIFGDYCIFSYDEDELLVACPNISKTDMEKLVLKLKEGLSGLSFAVAAGHSWSVNVNIQNQITESEIVMENDKIRLMHGKDIAQQMTHSISEEIDNLMANGQFLVYLQPKVHIKSRITVGAEALVRQMDPAVGIVGPGSFIPTLERYNLIYKIDLFVLEQALSYQQRQIEMDHRTVPISVNFSKKTVMYPCLIERVQELVKKYPVPKELIVIEITETVGDMDHIVIEDVANQLKNLGFKLSMDDFGSHYSNLAVLIQYDFDSAKIDRSMVTEITRNPKSRIVLNYMTSLINELGIHCIVEGIETKEQVEILKNTKAEIIQGYFFGKPVPMEEFYDDFVGIGKMESSVSARSS